MLPGTDDRTLDRGAGHIEDTPRREPRATPASPGTATASSADSRTSPPATTSSSIRSRERTVYRIERTWVVEPEDVSVLDPTPTPALTLVTCYPFYFVGSAPQRFIVRAVRVADTTASTLPSAARESCSRCEDRPLAAAFWPWYVTSMSRKHAAEWRVL